jgi:hypothetical protein
MYRGVVQAGGLWSEYLTGYIKSREMELPVGRGRIWRVCGKRQWGGPRRRSRNDARAAGRRSNPKAGGAIRRSGFSSSGTSAAPALKTLAGNAADWRTRLHALWTLDGLDVIDVASVKKALSDANADVRASAVRLSERWLGSDPR